MFGDVAFAQSPFASLGGRAAFALLVETVAAVEEQSADSRYGGLTEESAAGAMSCYNSNNTLLASVATSAQATDAQSASGIMNALAAATATATDSPSNTAVLNAAQAESAAADDIPTAGFNTAVSIIESALGADAILAGRGFPVTVEEASAAAAEVGASLVAIATVAEIAAGTAILTPARDANVYPTGVQLYVIIGDTLVWAVVDDTQDPGWTSVPT